MIMPGWQDYALSIDRMCSAVWGGRGSRSRAAEGRRRVGHDHAKARRRQRKRPPIRSSSRYPACYADHTIEKIGQAVHIDLNDGLEGAGPRGADGARPETIAVAPTATVLMPSSSSDKRPCAQTATAGSLPSPARREARLGLGGSPFQMADGRAGERCSSWRFRSIRCCSRSGSTSSTTTSRFPATHSSGCRIFSRSLTIRWPGRRFGCHDRVVADRGRRSSSFSAWRWRWRWSKTFRGRGIVMSILIIPLVHQPGDRRPVVGAVPAEALRPRRLPAEPAARPPGRDQLGRRGSLGLFRDRPGRRLAMDAVHVRHPAGGVGGHPAASLRGGGARRRRRAADLPLCDAAAARPGHAARRHASACSTRSSSSTSSSC